MNHHNTRLYLAMAAALHGADSLAASCAAPSVVMDTLTLRLPCVAYQNQNYQATLLAAQGVPDVALAWQLDLASLQPADCTPDTVACATTDTNLGIQLSGLNLGGKPHSAQLAFTPNPGQEGLFWKYVAHQEQQASNGNDTVTGGNTTPTDGGQAVAPKVTPKDINVRVSYYDTFENTKTKQDAITASLRHLSEAVYEASNGAHRIGKATVFTDGAFADDTDILWLNDVGSNGKACWFNANVGGRGRKGARVQHCDIGNNNPERYNMLQKVRAGGYTLGHEWGHFFYGLFDEYQGKGECDTDRPNSPCASDQPVVPAIMNSQWQAVDANGDLGDVKWLNFSTALNNTGNTAHNRVYAASGWETLLRNPEQDPRPMGRPYYPELAAVAPQAGQEPTLDLLSEAGLKAASEAVVVTFKPGSAATDETSSRRADGVGFDWLGTVRQMVIDRSSAVTPQRLDDVKTAVQNLINQAEVGDVIGVVAFDAQPQAVIPLTLIQSEETRDALIATLESLTPGSGSGQPNLNLALDSAAHGIEQAKVSDDFVWSVYLFADMKSMAGQNAKQISAQLQSVNFGSMTEESLQKITTPELANFLKSAQALYQKDISLNVISMDKDEAANLVMREVTDWMGGMFFRAPSAGMMERALGEIQAASSPAIDVTVDANFIPVDKTASVPVYLDGTLGNVEITLAFFDAPANMNLVLEDPKGVKYPVTAEHCGDVVDEAEVGEVAYSYCMMELYQPEPGQWRLHAAPVGGRSDLLYLVQALPADNEKSFFASVYPLNEASLAVNKPVVVEAMAGADLPVTDIAVNGVLETPDADAADLPLAFVDDGISPDETAHDGIYTAQFIPTQAGEYLLTVRFDNTQKTGQFTDFGVAYAPFPDGSTPSNSRTPVGMAFYRAAFGQLFVE